MAKRADPATGYFGVALSMLHESAETALIYAPHVAELTELRNATGAAMASYSQNAIGRVERAVCELERVVREKGARRGKA